MKTLYFSEKILNHSIGFTNYTPPNAIYIGLFTESPNHLGQGGVELINAANYSEGYNRISIGSSLLYNNNGYLENNTVIEFNQAISDWQPITAIGLFDAATSGNLLSHKRISVVNILTNQKLKWTVGNLKIAYENTPMLLEVWDDRPKTNMFDGHTIIFNPTAACYRFSSAVGDYVRAEYYDMFNYQLTAELSGEYLPLNEPKHPWDLISGDNGAWSIFNDGNNDWVRMNSTIFSSGVGSHYSIRKNLDNNELASYHCQGWIHVPTKSGQLSSNSSILYIYGARNDDNVASYTFSAHNSPFQNRLSHAAVTTAAGPYLYLSPTTNSQPVWFEIYFLKDKNDSSKFKSLIYVNNSLEPFSYYDENYSSWALAGSYAVIYGDMGTDNVDMKTRDFKFCVLNQY
jgi:hypothetical protein